MRPSLDFRLDGRAAWVTGASRGLGRAIALALAESGAQLLLTARDELALTAVAETIASFGGTAQVLAGSVTQRDHIEKAVEVARRTWGRLDVVVNNAGISPAYQRMDQLADQVWTDILDTNLTAPVRCAIAALPLLEASDAASVVNVSSIHGHAARRRVGAYAASKAGLEMATRCLALEWASRGVRVNSIAPGYLTTDMTHDLRMHEGARAALLERIPLGRFGSVEEVASVAVFLAGRMSSYLTGTTVFADGGWTAQ